MANQEIIIPNAINIANNLNGVAYSTAGTYRLPAKKKSKYSNPYIDAVEFFANIYNRELKIAVANILTPTDAPVQSPLLPKEFTPNVNLQDLTLGTVVAFSETEWEQLQITISRAFNIVYPFNITGPWSVDEINAYETLMGTFYYTGTDLRAADGTILDAGPINAGPDYANAWNELRVPYDRANGVQTQFIAPILIKGEDNPYYRFTGDRRWFGFQGYDTF